MSLWLIEWVRERVNYRDATHLEMILIGWLINWSIIGCYIYVMTNYWLFVINCWLCISKIDWLPDIDCSWFNIGNQLSINLIKDWLLIVSEWLIVCLEGWCAVCVSRARATRMDILLRHWEHLPGTTGDRQVDRHVDRFIDVLIDR